MSYQKKSVILQELENAIRKKAQQKSRNKEHVNKLLLSSIQKRKRQPKKAIGNKECRVTSVSKQSQEPIQYLAQTAQKGISIFNNQQISTEYKQLKQKKYHNRKLDKLVSFIHYMVSSTQKLMKYISSSNFQAEFAVKLYRSDKQNLLNQLKNLTFDDILESQRSQNNDKNCKIDQTNLIIDENHRLKKQIIVLEKETERFHQINNYMTNSVDLNPFLYTKQICKLYECLQKLFSSQKCQFIKTSIKNELKYEVMLTKNLQINKKIEIQEYLNQLENQRFQKIENFKAAVASSKVNSKIIEIRDQKNILEKEISILRLRINQLNESNRYSEQVEILNKKIKSIKQKLIEVVKESGENYDSVDTTDQLISYIKRQLKIKAELHKNLIKENSKLENQIYLLNQSIQNNHNNRIDTQDFKLQIDALEKQNIDLKYEFAQMTKLKANLQKNKEFYQKQMNQIKQSNNNLMIKISQQQEQINKQITQIKKQTQEKTKLHQNLNLKQNKIKIFENQILNYKAKLSNRKNEQEKANFSLKTKIIQLQEENNILSQNLKIKQQELNKKEVNSKNQHFKDFTNQKIQLTKQIKDIEYQKRQLILKYEQEHKLKNQIQQKWKLVVTENENKMSETFEHLRIIQEQKNTLSQQIRNYRVQYLQQIDLNNSKIKQYVCLLKKILRGLDIEDDLLNNFQTIQELLELGCKKIVETKKRLRQEASNRRRSKLQEQKDLLLEDVQTELEFQNSQFTNKLPIMSPKNQPLDHKEQINQFNLTEINKLGAQQNNIKSGQQFEGNFDEFKQIDQNLINSSFASQVNQKKEKSLINQDAEMNGGETDKLDQKFFEFRDISDKLNESAVSNDYDKKSNADFSQFQEIHDDLNQSKNSSLANGELFQADNQLHNFNEKKLDKSDVSQISNNQEQIKLNNLNEFQQFSSNLNQSVISKDLKQEDNNLQDFNDFESNKDNNSIISQQNNMNAFDEMPNIQDVNNSILSESQK